MQHEGRHLYHVPRRTRSCKYELSSQVNLDSFSRSFLVALVTPLLARVQAQMIPYAL